MLRSINAAPVEFHVLLGPDYAGKSTLFRALSQRSCGHLISCDDCPVAEQLAVAGSFRKAFAAVSSPTAGRTLSQEFVVSLFHAYLVFVRDQIAATRGDKPVIVDSYYYKILAKCVLTGVGNEGVFNLWRSFPQPSRVFYLDIDVDAAWERCDRGGRLNNFEYYGPRPTRSGFDRFQGALRSAMLKEVPARKITVIDQHRNVEDIVEEIENVIEPERLPDRSPMQVW
jgi:thymidylate kinase